VYSTLSCNEICMPGCHWFMRRTLFSVLSLKMTLHTHCGLTCTKPQHACCLPTADEIHRHLEVLETNLGHMKTKFAPMVCAFFHIHQFVHIIFIICLKWDLILSHAVFLGLFGLPSGCIPISFCQNSVGIPCLQYCSLMPSQS
jgi:hypothetical protein